jgi:hypothetical protein
LSTKKSSIYSAEYAGMDIELADIRLFYVDSAGDQIEIVSDEDICFAIREYTYNLSIKNLSITSPLITTEGYKVHGETMQHSAHSLSQQQKPDVVADEALPITAVSAALALATILPEESPKSVVEPPPTLAILSGPPSTPPLVANLVVEQGVATKLMSLSPARRIYNRELLIQYVHCFPVLCWHYCYLLALISSSLFQTQGNCTQGASFDLARFYHYQGTGGQGQRSRPRGPRRRP